MCRSLSNSSYVDRSTCHSAAKRIPAFLLRSSKALKRSRACKVCRCSPYRTPCSNHELVRFLHVFGRLLFCLSHFCRAILTTATKSRQGSSPSQSIPTWRVAAVLALASTTRSWQQYAVSPATSTFASTTPGPRHPCNAGEKCSDMVVSCYCNS